MTLLTLALLIVFPGRQTTMALSLATGIGVPGLQAKVDRLEEKAIRGEEFTQEDKAFLLNLYTCCANGGKLIVVARQSGAMMDRYLEASGEDLRTAPRVFLGSRPVQREMDLMRKWIGREAEEPNRLKRVYTSKTFHMADREFFESLTGLYYGRLIAKPTLLRDGTLEIHWRAEVPWRWPSYEYLRRTYGNYHAWCFPLPNAKSLLFGSKHCLRIDDGLGEHLVKLGMAKPFLVYSEWDETVSGTTSRLPRRVSHRADVGAIYETRALPDILVAGRIHGYAANLRYDRVCTFSVIQLRIRSAGLSPCDRAMLSTVSASLVGKRTSMTFSHSNTGSVTSSSWSSKSVRS